jgi:hypothetical protein
MEAVLFADTPRDHELAYVAPWERVDSPDDSASLHRTKSDAASSPQKKGKQKEGEVLKEQEEAQPDIVCKTHGHICTKKLCLDYGQQLREWRQKAKAKAKAQAKASEDNDNGSVHGKGALFIADGDWADHVLCVLRPPQVEQRQEKFRVCGV